MKNKDEKNPEGYPLYPASEDIYSQFKNEADIDPEDLSKVKKTDQDDDYGSLDIPGAELDDEQEKIGSEDEENNYYSIGGDNHDDLEEDKDE